MHWILLMLTLMFGSYLSIKAAENNIDFSGPAHANLDLKEQTLLSEYAAIYPKIKDLYGNMEMEINAVELYYSTEQDINVLQKSWEKKNIDKDWIDQQINRMRNSPERTERQYVIQYRSDGFARVDSQMNHSDAVIELPDASHRTPSQEISGFVPTIYVNLQTPVMYYALSKTDIPSIEYYSLKVKRNTKSSNAVDIGIPLLYCDNAPFCCNSTPLDKVLFYYSEKPYPRIEYVRQREIEGTQIIEIRWSPSKPEYQHLFGEIKLYRDSWVIKETYSRSQVILPDGNLGEVRWVREKCSYGDSIDNVPILKTYQRSFGTYNPIIEEEVITQEDNFEVTNFVPGPPDLSEFDVAQFLPPGTKIGELTYTQFSIYRIAAIAFGIILVIIGIFMKIRFAIIEARKQQKE